MKILMTIVSCMMVVNSFIPKVETVAIGNFGSPTKTVYTYVDGELVNTEVVQSEWYDWSESDLNGD